MNTIRMRRTVALILLTLSGLQGGCYSLSSYNYFHTSPDSWEAQSLANEPSWRRIDQEQSFHLEIEGVRFRGWLRESVTLIPTFLPGIIVVIFGHNPYHLELSAFETENSDLRILTVCVDDLKGKVLFDSENVDDVFPIDATVWSGWTPVLAWDKCRLTIPWFRKKVILRVEYEMDDRNASEPRRGAASVVLIRVSLVFRIGPGMN